MRTETLVRSAFGEAAKNWLESRRSYISPKTFHEYELNIKTLSAFFGEMRLPEITPDLIRAYQKMRLGQCGPFAINHECSVLQQMLKSKFKIGGDAAASAGPVGRNAQAGTDWKLNAEFLTYSRSRGLFAGLDLDGTVLSANNDVMTAEYGSPLPFESVLHGSTPVPENARRFVSTVAHYFVAAKER